MYLLKNKVNRVVKEKRGITGLERLSRRCICPHSHAKFIINLLHHGAELIVPIICTAKCCIYSTARRRNGAVPSTDPNGCKSVVCKTDSKMWSYRPYWYSCSVIPHSKKSFVTRELIILLSKFPVNGIRGTFLSWLNSYLENRSHCVCFDGINSSTFQGIVASVYEQYNNILLSLSVFKFFSIC